MFNRRAAGDGISAFQAGTVVLRAGAVFFIAAAALFAGAVTGRAADGGFEATFSINRQKATIGDDIVVAADIVHDDLFKISDLPKGLQVPPFIVKKVERVAPKKARGVTAEGFRITLTVFETGIYEVPPIPIRFKDAKGKPGVVYTEKWAVEIFSVLGNQKDTGDIRPLKSPESLETEAQRRRRWMAWAMTLAAGLVAALLVWWGWKRYEAWREARKPAHQRALEALDRLEKKELIASGQPKIFYAELTDILKVYLIRRFRAGSLDQTTREFMGAVEANPQAAGIADDARSVLAAADLVKFARANPSAENAHDSVRTLRDLVVRSKPAERAGRAGKKSSGEDPSSSDAKRSSKQKTAAS